MGRAVVRPMGMDAIRAPCLNAVTAVRLVFDPANGPPTSIFEAYHREWQLHWTYQQQQQQKQLGQPATYAFTAQHQQAYSQLPLSSTSTSLYQLAQQPIQPAHVAQPEVQGKTPLPPVFGGHVASASGKSEQRPSVMNYPAPSTILRPPKGLLE